MHQAGLTSHASLPHGFEFNSALYYVSGIASLATAFDAIAVPAYLRLDSGLVWHPTADLDLGLWGQNLLDARHMESTTPYAAELSEVPRSAFLKITKHF